MRGWPRPFPNSHGRRRQNPENPVFTTWGKVRNLGTLFGGGGLLTFVVLMPTYISRREQTVKASCVTEAEEVYDDEAFL